MVKYEYRGEDFVIEDFQNAKTFASFLPAVAGVDGKPLWAFYCNLGQAMASFGVDSKDTPITPFDSANLAYQNIALKGFRTFLKVDENEYTPFLLNHFQKEMKIRASDFSISEQSPEYRMEVCYSSVSHRSYPGLLRIVTFTNECDEKKIFEFVDGLPIFFPHGLSNIAYKELVSLMAAYCIVVNREKKAPFVKFKTSTGDNSVVSETQDGNGFVAVDEKGNKLDVFIDPSSVFGKDVSLITANPFFKNPYEKFIAQEEQTENKLPCAFVSNRVTLKPHETYSYAVLFGTFDSLECFQAAYQDFSFQKAMEYREETRVLLKELTAPAEVHTGIPVYDRTLKQSYLDNNLRGGFPTLLNNGDGGEVYYVFGRKHGDMERDYNSFQMPSKYYSSGPGNFRDVNQNRRNDLFFHPYVKDYNVKLFFSLIQADGQNPLNVKPESFVLNQGADLSFLDTLSPRHRSKIIATAKRFEPSELYTYLKDEVKKDADELFAKILGCCHQEIQANFAEGYWVDHWTYNVDLLENYSSVYPDQEETSLFDVVYPYFYSPVYVNPREEKYCLVSKGKIRQYGAIDLKQLKQDCEKRGFDLQKTAFLTDGDGHRINTNLAGKIYNLALVKFSTLDSEQLGIEMECEKPGWNDAMNGLPGLFSSGMSETIELLRLVNYGIEHLSAYPEKEIPLMKEQAQFRSDLFHALEQFENGKLSRFDYWDKATTAREGLRLALKEHASGEMISLKVKDAVADLSRFVKVLEEAIQRAKEVGNGVLPSYLIYDVDRYEQTGKTNHLGYPTIKPLSFKLRTIPVFLEASARAYKLGPKFMGQKDYEAIKKTDAYDKKLHFYKTCAALDDAPFEIGRVHAFTKGWLERECNFLHMSYKYLLGLLKCGLYGDFFEEIKTNYLCFMDPSVYGRDPAESSSFVVPTCNPDSSKWGQGFFARLTGANAEFLNMFVILFAGERLFSVQNGILTFTLQPKLSKEFFDENDEVSFLLFSKTKVIYHNPQKLDCYRGVKLTYQIDGKTYDSVQGALAEQIREGLIETIRVEISK